MVWIDFDFDFEPLALKLFFETEGEEVLDFFFDFEILEVEVFFAVVFLRLELRAEANDGWMMVMGVALIMRDETIGVSVDFVGEVVIGD